MDSVSVYVVYNMFKKIQNCSLLFTCRTYKNTVHLAHNKLIVNELNHEVIMKIHSSFKQKCASKLTKRSRL